MLGIRRFAKETAFWRNTRARVWYAFCYLGSGVEAVDGVVTGEDNGIIEKSQELPENRK